MKKIIVFFICAFLIGCMENNGDTIIETGGASAENQSESNSTVEQSQIDELAKLMPELICTDCDQAQVEATGRMYETLLAIVQGQQAVLPGGQRVETPLTPTQINIAIDAYSEAVNTLTEGADTQTTEAVFDDAISDIIDMDMSGEVAGGEVI